MPRRFLISLVAGLLVIGMSVPAVAAQDEPAFVYPCIDGVEFTAEPGQPLDLGCGWGVAGGPGKITSYLTAHVGTLVIRDSDGVTQLAIDAKTFATLWLAPNVFPADDEFVDCAGPTGRVIWWEELLDGGLPAGTYEITLVETLRHPVTDGYHTCWLREDGSRLVPPPSLYRGTFEAVTTLVVE